MDVTKVRSPPARPVTPRPESGRRRVRHPEGPAKVWRGRRRLLLMPSAKKSPLQDVAMMDAPG
jgi:hypothetical protein